MILKVWSNGRDFFELEHIVEIWGKPVCPYCEKAKALSRQEGLNYVYHQLDEDFTIEELKEKFPNAKTFPQITVDGKYIGGFQEYRIFIKGPPQNRA